MNFTLVYGQDLSEFPKLTNQMFKDRGTQFKDRLGWELDTDTEGRERDEYDDLNPLYVIVNDDEGNHLGSSRVMPTTGRTMLGEHFSHLTDGVAISSAAVWETTRFFISDRAHRRVAPALMWAGCALGLQSGVDFYASVTGAHLLRVFKLCGWPPEVIGRADSDEGEICAVLWEVSQELCDTLARKAGLPAGGQAPDIFVPAGDIETKMAA
ncbi:MAG: acyl-homoserine-lactone synthase [Pseudomonadota bacterium]